MELVCPHCRQLLQYTGKRPAFCAYCGKQLPSAADDPTIGADTVGAEPSGNEADDPAEIGGYRLLRLLGKGGMGRVYEAEQTTSGRRVAVKLIAARHVESAASVERFRREGRLASAVAHPRCVFILAADETGGRPYIVMELMPGTTLQDLVERDGPLPVDRALVRILDVVEGLRELHRQGIVHRDVKPSNCLVDSDDRTKIGDFGLSRSLVQADALTRTGTFIGTPLFAAPEQIKGGTVGPRADVYSVAATLYYLLTGQAPFQGGDAAATLARIVSDPAPSMLSVRPDLPVALDRVVLRGLERDPAKRWRDLDAFAAALLPFQPGRLSIGGLGIRFGAFAIDYACLFALSLPLVLLAVAQTTSELGLQAARNPDRQFVQMLAGLLLWLLYFGGCEALWGCTPGKRWLGLRVCKPPIGERPGVLAAILRTGFLYLFLNLGTLLLQALMLSGVLDASNPAPENQMLVGLVFTVVFYPLLALGIGLVLCTMRARNGYRGLHEFLSGTCVVRLPETVAGRMRRGADMELATSAPEGLPARIGPFDVAGLIANVGRGQTLLAHDASLGRRVWIWRRSADEPPLNPARHGVSRSTRLRWLAGDLDASFQWDAFLAPTGGALANHPSAGQLSWGETRLVLAELTDELTAARADGTLPEPLSVALVWLRSDGRVTLLDTALAPVLTSDETSPLSLIAQTALLALGATPRSARGRPIAVGAPLPRHALAIMGRLVGIGEPFADVHEFQTALAGTRDKPAQTTQLRRFAQLALLTAFCSMGFCCGFGPAALIPSIGVVIASARIERLESLDTLLVEVTERDKKDAHGNNAARRQAALLKIEDDTRLARSLNDTLAKVRAARQERMDALSSIGRTYADAVEKQMADAKEKNKASQLAALPPASEPDSIRTWVRLETSQGQDDDGSAIFGMAIAQTLFLVSWPILWIVWAFLTRGGLSFPIAGLALARRDGRPALRVQCAWRALLIWAPIAVLAVAAVWLDVWYWTAGHEGADGWMMAASVGCWWAAIALVPIYAALALWCPVRSLHDKLAGTFVVPR